MKRFKKAILHIGSDKTGSTAIQAACDTHRALLQQHGVYYPSGHWHAELGSCFCGAPEQYIHNVLSGQTDHAWLKARDSEYLDNLRRELQQLSGTLLVFSYEGFLELDIAALERLKKFIGEYAAECEVVCYVRDPLSYAVSAMSQRVKSGSCAWISNDLPILPLRDYLHNYASVFGKKRMNVRMFSKQTLPQGDVVLDFLSLISLPSTICGQMTQQSKPRNEALSAEALQIGESLVKRLDGRILRRDFEITFGDVLAGIHGGKIRLNAQQVSEIKRESGKHCDYLLENFGITLESESAILAEPKRIIAQETLDSLSDVLIGLVLPAMKPSREVNSDAFFLISAVLRQGATVVSGQLLIFDVIFKVNRVVTELEAGIHIWDAQGKWAFGTNSTLQMKAFKNIQSGYHQVSHYVVADLAAGRYTAGFAFAEKSDEGIQELFWRDIVCDFVVEHNTDLKFAGYACLAAEVTLQSSGIVDDSLVVDMPIGRIEPVAMPSVMMPKKLYRIAVAVSNTGSELWVGDCIRPVNLSYHWYDEAGKPVLYEGHRTGLPQGGIAPGSTVSVDMGLEAPTSPGRYRLVLTLVQEEVGWFECKGFEPTHCEVVVA